jgi:hypothetical protein
MRGPRPRGRTAHGHTTRPTLAGPASADARRMACARVHAVALPGGALPGEPVAARHRRTGDGGATVTSDGRRDGCGPGDVARTAAVGMAAVGAAARGAECGLSGRRCPNSALTRAVGAARGGHAAAARCRAGPARRATSDKRARLLAISELKNLPRRN